MIEMDNIRGRYPKIKDYLDKKSFYEGMLSALHEDLGIDSYLEEQPGGVGVMFEHDKNVDKYEKLLDSLSLGDVFGAPYTTGTMEDKAVLDKLVQLVSESTDWELAYVSVPCTAYVIIDVSDEGSKIPVTNELLDKIFATGKELDKTIVYNDEKDEFVCQMNIKAEILGEVFDHGYAPTIFQVCDKLVKKAKVIQLNNNSRRHDKERKNKIQLLINKLKAGKDKSINIEKEI